MFLLLGSLALGRAWAAVDPALLALTGGTTDLGADCRLTDGGLQSTEGERVLTFTLEYPGGTVRLQGLPPGVGSAFIETPSMNWRYYGQSITEEGEACARRLAAAVDAALSRPGNKNLLKKFSAPPTGPPAQKIFPVRTPAPWAATAALAAVALGIVAVLARAWGWRAALVGGLLMALPLGEGLSRVWHPTPLYHFRLSLKSMPWHQQNGQVLWTPPNWQRHTPEALNKLAAGARQRKRPLILGLGDSIQFGSGLKKSQTYLARLPQHWPRGQRPLTVNLAVNGYNSAQQLEVLREWGPKLRPDVVLIHYWRDDPVPFVVQGHGVYNPDLPAKHTGDFLHTLALPTQVNNWLVVRSRLYQWLSFARRPTGKIPALKPTVLQRTVQAAKAMGARVMVLVSPGLSEGTPPKAALPPDLRHLPETITRWGTPAVDLSTFFEGVDPATIRLDPCCHFNAKGHALLAERLAPLVKKTLAADRH